MIEVCREATLQSALEKDMASLIAIPLYDGTVPHLQSVHLIGLTVMVEGMITKGTKIGKL